MARKVSDRSRELRYELVEALVAYVKGCSGTEGYTPEDTADFTKQVVRVAKFLGTTNVSLSPEPTVQEEVSN